MKLAAQLVCFALGLAFIVWLLQPLLFSRQHAPTFSEAMQQRQGEESTSLLEAPPSAAATVAQPTEGKPAQAESHDDTTTAGPPRGRDVYSFTRPRLALTGAAASREGEVKGGILIDLDARRILWAKAENELLPIASMTKLMTLLVVAREMQKRPELSPDTVITVSPAAASMGGTQVWLGAGETYSMRALLDATMVASANDAAYAVGQAVVPNHDIDTFITRMNRTAREVGMRRARFYNPHGLPAASLYQENRATALDMMVLAIELHRYPLALRLGGKQQAAFRRADGEILIMNNHNKLLRTVPGVYGMKTGFTRRAGFCLTVACTRDKRTLLAVGMGFPNKPTRDAFLEDLLDWGYEQTLRLDAEAATP